MTAFYAIVVSFVAFLTAANPVFAAEDVPMPRPRPAGIGLTYLPQTEDAMQSADEVEEAIGCRLRLSMSQVKAVSVPPLEGPGGCGAPDVVRLDGLILRDKTSVTFTPPPVLRCEMAEEVAAWVRDDMAPAAQSLGSTLKGIDNYNSFECRGRNRVKGTRLSEHGRANALDIRGIKLGNGKVYDFTDRQVAREFRDTVRTSVCARFTTVLGPGSDGYHEEHIHLDLAERRGGYRICQWDVRDPVPDVPLPRPRPHFDTDDVSATADDEK